MNAAWHRKHKMPRNPGINERVAWHLDHAVKCGCRAIPLTIRKHLEAHIAGKRQDRYGARRSSPS